MSADARDSSLSVTIADSADARMGQPLPALQDYEIVAPIGRGGMGVVYEAIQRSTGTRVAVKLMLNSATGADSLRRRFEREVDLNARLQHPNIVRLLDSGIHQGQYFFVMEYVDGRPLDAALPPGQTPVHDVLRILERVCATVDFAHQRGVLHRDLKPSNVLVDAAGEPHLLDFGLAKSMDPLSGAWLDMTLSEPGQILGTLGYMSPEQARGAGGVLSVRSDVYSLGAIGYQLLTGRLPCPLEGSLAEILTRIEADNPRRPSSLRSSLHPDLDAILLKALDKSAELRYATAGALAEDLRRFQADEPILARPSPVARRIARWVRRNRAVALVGGVAALVLVGLGVVSAVRITRERNRAIAGEQLARDKLHVALQAIDTLIFDTDQKLAGMLGTNDVRRSLLDVAIGFYESLPRDAALLGLEGMAGPQYGKLGDVLYSRGDTQAAARFYGRCLADAQAALRADDADDAKQREVAHALHRCALVQSEPGPARELLERACQVHRARLARDGSNTAATTDLAEALINLAEHDVTHEDPQAAGRACGEALQLQEQARARRPEERVIALQQSALHRRAVGVAAMLSSKTALAEACTRAAENARRLADSWPDDVEAQCEALLALSRTAGLAIEGDLPELAEAALQDALERAKKLIVAYPQELRFRLAAADVYSYLGNQSLERREQDEALKWFERGRDIVAPAFELQPNDAVYRRRYALSLWGIAAAHDEAGNARDAAKAFEDMMSVTEPLLAEDADGEWARARSHGWLVAGLESQITNPARAVECFRRGLEEIERLARIRPLDREEQEDLERLTRAARGVPTTQASRER